MVEKLSVEIELEGGDDVRKTLEDIVGGVDGLKAAAEELGKTDATVKVGVQGADEAKTKIDDIKGAAEDLGQTDATVNVGAEGAAETKGALDPLAQTATVIGTAFDGMSLRMAAAGKAVDSLGVAVERLGTRMTRALGPLGVFARALGPVGIALGVIGGLLVKFGDSSADALNKLTVESAKLGLTAQQLDILQQAFGKLGVGSDALASNLEKLKPLLGGGLMRVGDIVPPDVFTGLQQFIAQLEQMPDSIARTKLAIDTLGEALGGQVIAGLQTGSISAQNFRTAIDGITPATQQQRVEAAKYKEELNKLSAAWTELKASISPFATPLFGLLTQEIKNLKKDLQELMQLWLLAKATFQVFIAAVTGGDIGAAAKQAAAEYTKATQAMQQAGQAGQQAGQQAAQGAQLATVEFTRFGTVSQQAMQQTGQAAVQAGSAAAQAGQTAATGFMVWNEKLGAITQKQAEAAAEAARLGEAGAQAGQQAAGGATEAATAWDRFKSTLASITWESISVQGVAAWNALIGVIQNAINKLLQWIGLKGDAGGGSGGGGGGGGGIGSNARGGLLGGRGTGTSDSNLAWVSRGEYIMPARAVAQPGTLAFLEALRRSGGIPRFAEGGQVGGGGARILAGSADQLIRAYDAIHYALITLRRMLDQAFETIDRSLGGGGVQRIIGGVILTLQRLSEAAEGNARGGLLGGRGTGTSDSNLAWVSRGEHIMPAGAVRQPGVLAFLEALRRSGGNLNRVLDGMGRFALGGMVPRAIPAFATGGLAGGGNHVTIQFPGLPAIGGLRASSEVVEQLQKAATLAQVRSGGRKPSRYS